MRKLRVIFATGLLSVATLACNGTSTESPDSDLLRLMERLVRNPSSTESPELYFGHLPPDFDFPVPDDSVVLGGVVIPTEYGGTTHVVLDVPGTPDDVFSGQANALAAMGFC